MARILALSLVVCVVALSGVLPLAAVEPQDVSGIVSQGSVGFVAGQSIRVSVTSLARDGYPTPLPVLMTVHILDTNGNDLAVSPLLTVTPGQTRTFIVKRSSLAPQGEPGTGRLQVRPETQLQVLSQPLGQSQVVHTVGELVDDLSGKNSGMIGDIRTVISGEASFQGGNQGVY